MKYETMDWGTMEAVVNKLGGLEGVKKFLRGELIVSQPTRTWTEKAGVIYFDVTSDGTTGPEWEKWFDENKYDLSSEARFILKSKDFKVTSGVTTPVAVLKGNLFTDRDRITSKIRASAEGCKLTKPEAEVTCLIRRMFSDEELVTMGFYWIVVFHEPIKDPVDRPRLLAADRRSCGRNRLSTCYDRPDDSWDQDIGCAFSAGK